MIKCLVAYNRVKPWSECTFRIEPCKIGPCFDESLLRHIPRLLFITQKPERECKGKLLMTPNQMTKSFRLSLQASLDQPPVFSLFRSVPGIQSPLLYCV